MGELPSEEALMEAYQKGDGRAFERLFGVFAPRVHAFFMRSFADTATADDLLQLTFLKLHRARAQYRRGAPLRPWLFAIAARVRLDELRKRYRLPADADAEELEKIEETSTLPADSEIGRGETGARVRSALQRLPETQRMVIHLHHFEGMSFAEIAEVLGTTAGAAKLRAFRGYEQLRRELREEVDVSV
jgi:RNA polymerase sigma-70 factor (ECF subfamily)